jgi:hypothetical protein
LDIIALNHSFDALQRITGRKKEARQMGGGKWICKHKQALKCVFIISVEDIQTAPSLYPLSSGGMDHIQPHAFGLARYTHMLLSSLCHGNGHPVAQMYTQGQFDSPDTQGAILNFNLLDCRGHIIGYSQVQFVHFILIFSPVKIKSLMQNTFCYAVAVLISTIQVFNSIGLVFCTRMHNFF